MTRIRLPLDQPLNRAALPPATVLSDVCALLQPTTNLRKLFAGDRPAPLIAALIAALIVSSAELELAGGGLVTVEERALDDGSVDLSQASAILLEPTDQPSAWVGDTAGLALRLRLSGARIADASAAIAGIAPYAVRARQIEGALRGRSVSPQLLEIAGQTARIEAQPFGVGDVIDEASLDQLVRATRSAIELALSRHPSHP